MKIQIPNTLSAILELSSDPLRARQQLHSFLESFGKILSREFDIDTKTSGILFRIFGNSSLLAQKLINNPSWAIDICKSKYLKKRKPLKKIKKDLDKVIEDAGNKDTESLKVALRRYKYKEMIRIVARDITQKVEARDTFAEWSEIAESIVEISYAHTLSKLTATFGEHCTGSIIALGKLGAGELNLSSDIDLIFIYELDDSSSSGLTNHEFFEKLVTELSKFLSEVSAEGFLYRVDHELRPEGKQGPLANSIDAAERYYQYFGQDWERQALIRARPIAGNIKLGEDFLERLTPFIYRRSISLKDLSHMREMKLRIEKETFSTHNAYNVKLGPGGIREAEFFVQALQQFYGGKYPKVRSNNTFEAIDCLRKESLIHPHTAKSLTRAYAFLRRVENMLQADEDLQVHRIPKNEKSLEHLSRKLGLLNGADFSNHLKDNTDQIRRSFHGLFEADYELQELAEAIKGNLDSCTDDEERADSLAWFKNQEIKRIKHLDVNGKINLPTALRRITKVADVIVNAAWNLSKIELEKHSGVPTTGDGSITGFAIVGMGGLGSLEMDYGSDLDLIFLYSGKGKTNGKHSITNSEFYTKLAQRTISLLSLPTRYGKAYSVDPELRPSGRSGTLVASTDAFVSYHRNDAQLWERLSIMKARTVTGDEEFIDHTEKLLREMAYESIIPDKSVVVEEIDRLRDRSINERAVQKENHIDLKIGKGGLSDINLIIQFLQLTNLDKCKKLNTQNSFDILRILDEEALADGNVLEDLTEILFAFKLITSRLRLTVGRSADVINFNSDYIDELSKLCNFESPSILFRHIQKHRKKIQEIYDDVIKKDLP